MIDMSLVRENMFIHGFGEPRDVMYTVITLHVNSRAHKSNSRTHCVHNNYSEAQCVILKCTPVLA